PRRPPGLGTGRRQPPLVRRQPRPLRRRGHGVRDPDERAGAHPRPVHRRRRRLRAAHAVPGGRRTGHRGPARAGPGRGLVLALHRRRLAGRVVRGRGPSVGAAMLPLPSKLFLGLAAAAGVFAVGYGISVSENDGVTLLVALMLGALVAGLALPGAGVRDVKPVVPADAPPPERRSATPGGAAWGTAWPLA